MRISDWSSDVCSSDLAVFQRVLRPAERLERRRQVDVGGDIIGLQPQRAAEAWHRILDVAGRLQGDPEVVVDVGQPRPAPDHVAVDRRRVQKVAAAEQRAGVLKRVERSEEHTSELQSLMRISYAVFCLKKKKTNNNIIATE